MSKSDGEKMNYAARREMRLRRDKTAALLMPFMLAGVVEGPHGRALMNGERYEIAAERAVAAADALLAHLDATRPDLSMRQP